MKKINWLLLPVCLLLACSGIKMEGPAGFAEMTARDTYRAISPEGVIFKVRTIKNYPPKDLDFWGRALKNHLEEEGYQFLSEENFEAAEGPGLLFEWGAPYGSEDYIYLTAILVKGKKIAVAEAAGEFKLFDRYRAALRTSLTTLTLR